MIECHRNKSVTDHLVYSSVVSLDSLRLAFTLVGFSHLKLFACDIGNAFLNVSNREKVQVTEGKELFGLESKGKWAVICCALYALKSVSTAWRNHFHGFKSTIVDPEVYQKSKVRKDGTRYCSYLTIYVDDVLCLDEELETIINMNSNVDRMKSERKKTPDTYLEMNIIKW